MLASRKPASKRRSFVVWTCDVMLDNRRLPLTAEDRRRRQEDCQGDAPAGGHPPASPSAPAAQLTGRGGWRGAGRRELAELTGASAGCRFGRLRRMLGTHLSGRCARGQIRLTEPGLAGGRGGPRREGFPTQKNRGETIRHSHMTPFVSRSCPNRSLSLSTCEHVP